MSWPDPILPFQTITILGGVILSTLTQVSIVKTETLRLGADGTNTMPCELSSPSSTSPGTNCPACWTVPELPPAISAPLPSSGHQLTMPERGVQVGNWVTAKPFDREATSLPVVTATVWPPRLAPVGIVMLTVRLMALTTVTLLTVMSVPKFTVLLPCAKCVNAPEIAITKLLCPCCPVLGLTCVITGGPAVTVK